MASNDPGISELGDPVSVREVRDAPSHIVRLGSLFEDTVKTLFEHSKRAVKDILKVENATNIGISRILFKVHCSDYTRYDAPLDLRKAFCSVFASGILLAGPNVLDENLRLSNAEQSGVGKAFLTVVALMRRKEEYSKSGSAPEADFVKELENGIFQLYLLLKATFEMAAGYEVTIAEKEVEDVIPYAIDYCTEDQFFLRSFIALNILVGFIAAEMERAGSTAKDAVKMERPGSSVKDAVEMERPGSSVKDAIEMERPGSSVKDAIEMERPVSSAKDAIEIERPGSSVKDAVEMERVDLSTRDVASQADMNEIYPPNPFHFDLYLYMGYRYHIISEEDYRRLRSHIATNHFTSKIGKVVILLSHAYRPKIFENLIGPLPFFEANLKIFNSLYYITRFVRDSIKAHPSSSYRYMVLLCLISEITLALYYIKKNADPIEDYLNEACRYYKESGMILYETKLNNHDHFGGLIDQAKILDNAWKTVSLVAIDTVVSKSNSARDLIARYGDRLEGRSFELILSRNSPGDPDSEKDEQEKLFHDDEDFLIPEYQKVSDYLDSGRKSSLPKAEPEPAYVEGESNLEGQKGESSAKGRKGPADVEGKSNPEGLKDMSPTKRRKSLVDVEGKSNPEGQKDSSPTKRKDPVDVEGKSNPEGQMDSSPIKRSKGPADVEGKSNPEGQKDSSPTKRRKRPFSEAVECSPGAKSGLMDVGTRFARNFARQTLTSGQGLPILHVDLPIVPIGRRDKSSTQSPLHPSGEGKSSPGKAEKSSAAVQPKPADDGESNTDVTPENVLPTPGASQPKPKRKKSKRKPKGKR